jgi:peptidoglycan-N-acetylglucosamine deacetylase
VKKVFYLLIPLVLLISFKNQENKPFRWKNGAKAAICLTYDDGMQTQIDNAIPQLDEVGFKGTFFINTTEGRNSVIGWKNAAKSGHELGNHSLFHPCPGSFGWPKEIASDNYTIPQILNEIKTVNLILANLDPSRKTRSYSYPCNLTEVGGKSYLEPLRKSKLVSYARGGSGTEKIIVTDFSSYNKMNVPSWAVPDNVELKDLIDFAEKAREKGGLGVFQFHGVGGQWIKVSNETHNAFLKYLSDNKSDFWVVPFSEAIEYIEKNK